MISKKIRKSWYGVDAAHRQVVVGVLAVIEVEAAEHVFVDQERDDVLHVGARQVMSGVNQHLRTVPRFMRKRIGHAPIGDVRVIERGFKGLVLDEHRHVVR